MVDRPDYNEYLNSETWAAKRKKRLELDQYQCRKCNGTMRLRVHHRTYKNLGTESMDDLVTVCEDCHQEIHKLCALRGRSRSDEKVLAKITAEYLSEPTARAKPQVLDAWEIKVNKNIASYKQVQKAIQKLKAPNGKRYSLRRVNKGQEPPRYQLAYRADNGATIIDTYPPFTVEEACAGLDRRARLSARHSEAPAKRSPAAGGVVSEPQIFPEKKIPALVGDWVTELLGYTQEGDPIVILRKSR